MLLSDSKRFGAFFGTAVILNFDVWLFRYEFSETAFKRFVTLLHVSV